MLVVARFRATDADDLRARARAALDMLAQRPGFVSGRLGRATDDPSAWVVVMEWANVGSYRRALSSYDVKMTASPLLGLAVDGASAYEVLYDCSTGESESDRAPEG